MQIMMIEINNLVKAFKDNRVLNEVTIRCCPGKIYGIVGYNGSGKTVLFKCILGFLKPTSGEILVDGKQIGKDLDMLTSAGAIIEEPSFLKNKTAYQNLLFLYRLRNKPNKNHIIRVLETVGLDPKLKRHVGKFSLGMKQRLAIAQAIMEEPEILILDEPMNGLDKNGIKQMRELFLQMKSEEKTILLASHNKEDIDVLCDEVYEMDKGVLTQIR